MLFCTLICLAGNIIDKYQRENDLFLNAGLSCGITGLDFSPDGKSLLVRSTWDAKIYVLNPENPTARITLTSEKIVPFLESADSHILDCCFSPDGKLIASARSHEDLKIWDVKARKSITTLSKDDFYPTCLSFSPDNKTIVAGHMDRSEIYMWDYTANKHIGNLAKNDKGVWSLTFNQAGNLLAALTTDDNIILWDMQKRKITKRFELGQNKINIHKIAFLPDGKSIICVGFRKGISVRPWFNPKPIFIDFRRELFVTTSDIATGKTTNKIIESRNDLRQVAISQNCKLVAAGDYRNNIVWDVGTGKVLNKFPGGKYGTGSLQFSPDGKQLATDGGLLKVDVWKIEQ